MSLGRLLIYLRRKLVTIEEKLAVAKGGIIHVCGGYVFGKTFELSIEGEKTILLSKIKRKNL